MRPLSSLWSSNQSNTELAATKKELSEVMRELEGV